MILVFMAVRKVCNHPRRETAQLSAAQGYFGIFTCHECSKPTHAVRTGRERGGGVPSSFANVPPQDEPSDYSIEDLASERDQTAEWDGVRNYTVRRAARRCGAQNRPIEDPRRNSHRQWGQHAVACPGGLMAGVMQRRGGGGLAAALVAGCIWSLPYGRCVWMAPREGGRRRAT